MITGIHGLFYTSQADELRAFMRDKLGLPFTDVGGGWLIFGPAVGEVGVHPSAHGDVPSGTHNLSFYTDDLEATLEELKGRGVECDGAIDDRSYGFVTQLVMPGGVRVELYQPKYTMDAGSKPKSAKKIKKAAAKQAKAEAATAKKGKKSKGKKTRDKKPKAKDKKAKDKKKKKRK